MNHLPDTARLRIPRPSFCRLPRSRLPPLDPALCRPLLGIFPGGHKGKPRPHLTVQSSLPSSFAATGGCQGAPLDAPKGGEGVHCVLDAIAGLLLSMEWTDSVDKGETEAQRGELSELIEPSRCPGLYRGVSPGLFLISKSQTSSPDWAAPREVGCPQIEAAGLGWGGGQRGPEPNLSLLGTQAGPARLC